MIDPEIVSHLQREGIAYCVVGAIALAHHGVVRYSADVDLMTMSSRVLSREFWPATLHPRIAAIRCGDDDDPLRGVVRFKTVPPLDLIVGRGPVVKRAIEHAAHSPELGVPVPTMLDLALLKLEAGGPADIGDVSMLIDVVQRKMPDAPLLPLIEANAASLSAWGRRALEHLEQLLGSPHCQDG